MRTISIGDQSRMARSTMALMHEFRHEVFVRRLGWSLPLIEGVERDQYDRADTTYFVVSEAEGQVTACARLLPTTRSYMLPELFPQLLGGAPAPADPAVWELSRFAADVTSSGGRVLALSDGTLELLAEILKFGHEREIARLLLVTSIGIERLLLRAKVAVHRLAPPAHIEGSLCVALFIEVAPSLRQLTLAPSHECRASAAGTLPAVLEM